MSAARTSGRWWRRSMHGRRSRRCSRSTICLKDIKLSWRPAIAEPSSVWSSIVFLSSSPPSRRAQLRPRLPAAAQSTAEIGGLRFSARSPCPTTRHRWHPGRRPVGHRLRPLHILAPDLRRKSDKNPARFYTAKLSFDRARFASVEIDHAVTLLQADGEPYPMPSWRRRAGPGIDPPRPATGNLWWPPKATASSACRRSCASPRPTASRSALSRCLTSSR